MAGEATGPTRGCVNLDVALRENYAVALQLPVCRVRDRGQEPCGVVAGLAGEFAEHFEVCVAERRKYGGETIRYHASMMPQ